MSEGIGEKAPAAASLRSVDWVSTGIGTPGSWPPELRTAVGICLRSRFPMIIFWGPRFIQIYNDAYVTILGDKHPAAFGAPAAQSWPEIWGQVGPMLEGVFQTSEATFSENLRLDLMAGGRLEERYFTFSYSPIEVEGRVGGVFCAVSETTQTVRRERASVERFDALTEAGRVKGNYFSNVSHELRTPLTLMLGPLTELRKANSIDRRTLIDIAYRNTLRLLKLVDMLLEFSRIEDGRVVPSFVKTNLSSVTYEMIAMFGSAFQHAGLEIVTQLDDIDDAYVDRSMWERIVLNLLSNALKFTLRGEVRITLRATSGHFTFSVTDTGIGIAPEDEPRVFERFFRVRHADARSHEGSGIGLALVRELVNLHGGEITVRSELGRGSTFSVKLPRGSAHLDSARIGVAETSQYDSAIDQYLADVHSTLSPGEVAIAPIPTYRFEAGNILIVEDNADLRDYLLRLLSPMYNAVAVRSGAEALALMRTRDFNVVLSDIMMPDVDGFELVRAIRTDPRLAETRVVFLTARAGEETATAGFAQGIDDYVVKPFTIDDLLSRIRVQMRSSRRSSDTVSSEGPGWFRRAGDATASDATFRSFADELPIMLFQQDPSGAVSFTNRVWYETLGLPRDDASHTIESWRRIVHPDDLLPALDVITAAVASRQAWSLEYRLKRADDREDRYRWHSARGLPFFSADGEFGGWNCSIIDIHEARLREDVERTLRLEAARRERELRSLANMLPALIWTADASGWIDWYNRRWYEYTGQSEDEAKGWGWQAAHHPEDFPRVMEAWPHSIKNGVLFEMEFRLRRSDGVYHTFLTRAVPVRNERGEIYRWYGSNVDINEQKEAFERSRRIAQTLQGVFFPGHLPRTKRFRIDAVYQGAERDALVGGDWFDAIALPNGTHLLSIGDVTGHGLEASIVAARLRHAIIDFALMNDAPCAVLEHANTVLRMEYPGVYASALVGFIDADATHIDFASAGHLPPLVADGSGPARAVTGSGLLLGVSDDLEIVPERFATPPDCVVVLYTDGILEFTRDLSSIEEKLARAAASLVHDMSTSPASRLRDTVLDGASAIDDIAVLVVQFSDVALEPAQTSGDLRKHWRFHSSDARTAQVSRSELMEFLHRFAANNEELFEAEVVLGEILANTVEHAPGLVEVDIDWSDTQPVVTVRDHGPGIAAVPGPMRASPRPTLTENGRGLFLIQTLAKHVEIATASPTGTQLKATLPVKRVVTRVPD